MAAKQKSFIKIQGTVGDLTFYQKDGTHFLKTKSSISKEKIQSDPNFLRTRENNQEFAGSAKIAKGLRDGFNDFKKMVDSNVTGRAVKMCNDILKRDAIGLRGKRSFLPVPNKDLIKAFAFSKNISFDSIFSVPFAATVNTDRNAVSITIQDFNAANAVSGPSGATHFKLINLLSVWSSYTYNDNNKSYEATDAVNNSKNVASSSGYLALDASVGSTTIIASNLNGAPVLPTDSALLSYIGIEFYQKVNNDYYLLASGNAMKIQDVF